ncbi:MAG TPA: hypothetical protein VMU54_11540, partial [Planctomycetota bacterium]|nr:hypothetical protein [Planctomycetota bacterium]
MGKNFVLCTAVGFLGIGIGWSWAVRRGEPARVQIAPQKAPPDPELDRLRGELQRALAELASAKAQAAMVPPVREATPPKPPVEAEPLYSALADWTGELKGILRVKDALGVKIPPGTGQLEHLKRHAVFLRARELLKDEAAQLAFLSDLPTLSDRELTVL